MRDNLTRFSIDFSKIAIFLIYFWFGALKVSELSPASPLVLALLDRTMPFFDDSLFLVVFGLFEMIIGLLFLIKGMHRIALTLISLHILLIVSPLLLLPNMTWQGFLVPTLEGQYIIKNILIIAIVLILALNHDRKRS